METIGSLNVDIGSLTKTPNPRPRSQLRGGSTQTSFYEEMPQELEIHGFAVQDFKVLSLNYGRT